MTRKRLIKLDEYHPIKVLTVFKQKSFYGQESTYVEERAIRNGQMGAAVPISHQTIKTFVKTFSSAQIDDDGLLPTCCLARVPGVIVWYNRERRRRMFFAKGLGIKSGEAWCPPLLFASQGNKLHVYATKTNSRPTMKTKLYAGPFHNWYRSGMCMGSAKLKPAKSVAGKISAWEFAFFKSQFTHPGNNCIEKGFNLNGVWKGQVGTDRCFPREALLPTGTVGSLLKTLGVCS